MSDNLIYKKKNIFEKARNTAKFLQSVTDT